MWEQGNQLKYILDTRFPNTRSPSLLVPQDHHIQKPYFPELYIQDLKVHDPYSQIYRI